MKIEQATKNILANYAAYVEGCIECKIIPYAFADWYDDNNN
jgi:hypothetical protein